MHEEKKVIDRISIRISFTCDYSVLTLHLTSIFTYWHMLKMRLKHECLHFLYDNDPYVYYTFIILLVYKVVVTIYCVI